MSVKDAVCCPTCGEDDVTKLTQCTTCSARLSKGFKSAVCKQCVSVERIMKTLGELTATSSTAPLLFKCSLCTEHEKRVQEDKLLAIVGGPSPEQLLSTVAQAHTYLVLDAGASVE